MTEEKHEYIISPKHNVHRDEENDEDDEFQLLSCPLCAICHSS